MDSLLPGPGAEQDEQLLRISRYEAMMDEALRLLASERTEEEDAVLWETVAQLEAYYGSEAWRRDFEDDEAGLLPRELKRGVLSEDGLYGLLEEARELREPAEEGREAP